MSTCCESVTTSCKQKLVANMPDQPAQVGTDVASARHSSAQSGAVVAELKQLDHRDVGSSISVVEAQDASRDNIVKMVAAATGYRECEQASARFTGGAELAETAVRAVQLARALRRNRLPR